MFVSKALSIRQDNASGKHYSLFGRSLRYIREGWIRQGLKILPGACTLDVFTAVTFPVS